MKDMSFLFILGALLILWFVVQRVTEPFVPEFLDQGNVKRTAEKSSSSYTQDTNHFKMQPYAQSPLQGLKTPFRVNLYDSYMV